MILLRWAAFKAFVQAKSLSIQWAEDESFYYLIAVDGPAIFQTQISKTQAGHAADKTDFETNFKAGGNLPASIAIRGFSTVSGVFPAQAYSSKTRVDFLTTSISIPSNSTYVAIYNYTGSGFLIGCNLEFNNIGVVTRLQIDGESIFDGQSISQLNAFVVSANDVNRRQNGSGIVTSSSTIDWSLKNPIRFNSSVAIAARLDSGIIFRQFTQGVIYIVKET